MHWDRNNEGRHALRLESGTVLVRGCEFQEDKPQIELGEKVRRAVVSDNVLTGKRRITNHSKAVLNVGANPSD